MADREALTAKLSGAELEALALGQRELLLDAAFSLFGDSGKVVGLLPAVLDEQGNLLDSVIVAVQGAFVETADEETATALGAMSIFAAPSKDDTSSLAPLGSVVAALPTAPLAERTSSVTPPPLSDLMTFLSPTPVAGEDLDSTGSLAGVSNLTTQPSAPTPGAWSDAADAGFTAAAADSASAAANGTFDIEIIYSGNAAYRTYFDQAAARWEQIITADLADFAGIDDLRIDASVVNIDGSGGILGQAGWDERRPGATGLPYLGGMQFDSADTQNLVNSGGFLSVVLHEIGHILGIGTLWSNFGLLVGAGGSNPRYIGAHALSEYRALAGNPALTAIPVENSGGSGTRDAHWRESTFGNELLTGFLGSGANPLSRMTIGSLEDLGYTVNYAAADAYNIPGLPPPSPPAPPPPPPPPPPSSGPVQPVITFAGGGDTAAVSFGENAKTVGVVTATGAPSYSIVGGTDADKFQINSSSGALSFRVAPNFEAPSDSDANNSYVVQVRAANDSLFDTQTITVNVTNLSERPSSDHNGDQRSDLLWTHDNGQLAIWNMSGGQQSGYSFLGSVGSDWSVASTGDFNGDGHTDILWRHNGGSIAVWDIVSSQQVGYHFVAAVGNDWDVADTGDFNGDGSSDILWSHASGQLAIWDMNGGQQSGYHFLGSVGSDWTLVETGDFNGDRHIDVLWRHDSGAVAVWDIVNGTQAGYHFLGEVGHDWHVVEANDFNGDGRSDILWSHDSGQLAIWDMNGSQQAGYHFLGFVGSDWTVADTGDFNGDRHADILWRHTGGATAIWDMNGGQQVGYHFLANVENDWHVG